MAKNDTGMDSFVAGEALEPYRRVKPSAGNANTVVYADDAEDSIGVTTNRAASGAMASVDLWNKGGTFEITASGAITACAAVYGAADGKITATASGSSLGYAREAASGNNSITEVVLTGPEA